MPYRVDCSRKPHEVSLKQDLLVQIDLPRARQAASRPSREMARARRHAVRVCRRAGG